MNEALPYVTIAEAAERTAKSKSLIYSLIDQGKVTAYNSSAGKLVHLATLRKVLAGRRGPGRPRKAA